MIVVYVEGATVGGRSAMQLVAEKLMRINNLHALKAFKPGQGAQRS
jgi:hypothetical protein